MRFNLCRAALLCLVAAIPFGHAYPRGLSVNGRGQSLSLESAEITDARTFGGDADEEIKRRHVLDTIDPRVIPKLGEKPPTPALGKPDKPGLGTPGKPPVKPGDGPGGTSGTGSGASFADGNLEAARSKGAKLNSDLGQAIFKSLPAPERKVLKDLGYKQVGAPTKPYGSKPNYLDDLGVTGTEGDWVVRKVYREDKDGSSTANRNDPILEVKVDAGQHTIIVERSFKDRDQANPQATWSDMMHSSWRAACLGGEKKHDPKDLRLVLRKNIVDIDTVDSRGVKLNTPRAIDAAFKKLQADKTKVLTLEAKSDKANMKASYELLSAQTHVARVLQWLKDRHDDMGNKKINKLHIATPEHYNHEYTIAIELI